MFMLGVGHPPTRPRETATITIWSPGFSDPEGLNDDEQQRARPTVAQSNRSAEVTITVQNAVLSIVGATNLIVSNTLGAVYEVLKCRFSEGSLRPRTMIYHDLP